MMDCKCKGCGRRPEEINEYIQAARNEDMTPLQYVQSEEGTYNYKTGLFYCTLCYVRAGMPLGTA